VAAIFPSNWSDYGKEIENLLCSEMYDKAISLLEDWIEKYPQEKSFYAYLGLVHLLQRNEEDAQSTWMAPCLGFEEDVELLEWVNTLASILRKEADRRIEQEDVQSAWLIYQHSREIVAQDIHASLQLLRLSLQSNTSPLEELENFLNLDRQEISSDMDDIDLLMSVVEMYLSPSNISIQSLDFIEFCEPAFYTDVPRSIYMLMRAAVDYASQNSWLDPSIRLAQLSLRLDSRHFEALGHLSGFYYSAQMYDEGIDAANFCLNSAITLPQKIHAYSMLMRGVMGKGGEWNEAIAIFEKGQDYFEALLSSPALELNQTTSSCIFNAAFFHPYIFDDPASTRELQNRVAEICQSVTQFYAEESVSTYAESHASKLKQSSFPLKRRLKIGYLCHCFRSHSVGWLARWLIKYHDRDRFELYGYSIAHRIGAIDPLQRWYEDQFENFRQLGVNAQEIADIVHQDDLDILIDLDSITLDISFAVMAMKPAPIQATWLGLDASGLQSIDYFIADSYVLPDSASSYYKEKIIRLPGPYLAVNGFEVDVPNITRADLSIPDDAVTYLSCQSGLKRNVETVRCQLKIIRAVENSYFLIKGIADQSSVMNFFVKLATEEGVNPNRLRFLPNTPSEAVHRANLRIADVILDTYPYNGATTTMETLWMEVPIVTRVGGQFAARNSYTMMMNVGIIEGIAWGSEEYIEWGVRFGLEPELRQQVSWKLRQSKQNSPLWDSKLFAKQMEQAYLEMYNSYVREEHHLQNP
jgi:predicted O-linked N-acetylglucosamine transferase (SPINDLY family)